MEEATKYIGWPYVWGGSSPVSYTHLPGVFLVSTASHGGTMVATAVAAVLSPAAKKCGFKDKGYICYEEDAQMCISDREKRGIIHNEILLPAHAPRSYADRNTLWNAAEAVEKQWNSQLARRWVLTLSLIHI